MADGFTSIVDLGFGRDGALHVVEIDEASWLAVELDQATSGTIDTCDLSYGVHCHKLVGGLPIPTAVASTRKGTFATIWSLVPGKATVTKIA